VIANDLRPPLNRRGLPLRRAADREKTIPRAGANEIRFDRLESGASAKIVSAKTVRDESSPAAEAAADA